MVETKKPKSVVRRVRAYCMNVRQHQFADIAAGWRRVPVEVHVTAATTTSVFGLSLRAGKHFSRARKAGNTASAVRWLLADTALALFAAENFRSYVREVLSKASDVRAERSELSR